MKPRRTVALTLTRRQAAALQQRLSVVGFQSRPTLDVLAVMVKLDRAIADAGVQVAASPTGDEGFSLQRAIDPRS